jgi:hypothetical protein
MHATTTVIPALFPRATPSQSKAVLGAMRAIAETGGPASDADRAALAGADRYIFGHEGTFSFDTVAPVSPQQLAAALAGSKLGEDAVKFATVMALVDGRLDKAKIAAVESYAKALGISGRYLDEISEAADGRLQEALADMTRANMESVTGKAWSGDVNEWLLPYAGDGADPALAARFKALGALDPASFGHAFFMHFTENGYDFPGDPKGLNAIFSLRHDSAHVLSGYDTTARGELLVSTFTAAMHPNNPMAGHILPVIFSWHLKEQINTVAGKAEAALDPKAFWQAWAAGAATTVDTFDPTWDFWQHVKTPLTRLRESYAIPAAGVEGTSSAA